MPTQPIQQEYASVVVQPVANVYPLAQQPNSYILPKLPKEFKNQFSDNISGINYFILFLITLLLFFIMGPIDLLMLLTLRQKIIATNNGLEIQGAFSKRLVPWNEINRFVLAPTPYVYTRSGKKYNISSAFYVKLMSKVNSKRQNDPRNVAILSELNGLARQYSPNIGTSV
jgi:hypothetical protein